jgi:hypothetical protein
VRCRSHGRTGLFYVCAILAAAIAGLALGLRVSLLLWTALAFASVVVGIRRPVLGLFGIGMLCTLDPLMTSFVFTGGLLRWNTLNYWLLLVTLLWMPLFMRRRDAPLRLMLLCSGLLALELLFSHSPARGVQDLLGMMSVFGIFTYCARRDLRGDDWFWLGVICGVLAAAAFLLYAIRGDVLPVINPNARSALPLCGLFALCLALPFASARRRGTFTVSVLVAIALISVFLSGSRGAMLVAAACAIYVLVGLRSLGRRLTLIGIFCLVVVTAATQFSDLQQYALGRVQLLFDRQTALVDRTSHRSELLLGGWYVFLEHPLGVGTGGFTDAWRNLGRRPGLPSYDSYRNKDAHAGWIKILAENGIPGFVLLLGFVLSFAFKGLNSPVREMRGLGLLATAALLLEFVSAEYQNKAIWFFAAAVIVMLGTSSPLLQLRRRRHR